MRPPPLHLPVQSFGRRCFEVPAFATDRAGHHLIRLPLQVRRLTIESPPAQAFCPANRPDEAYLEPETSAMKPATCRSIWSAGRS
jgi:hypothetical protein